MNEQFTWKNCILVLVATVALGGCDDGLQDPEDRHDLDALAEPGVPESSDELREFTGSGNLELTGAPLAAMGDGWTDFTSEEDPPILCEGKTMVNGFACRGKFCDDIRMYCQPTAHAGSNPYWTPPFSEEDHGFQSCTAGAWVVGLQCSGKFCDNVSLRCRSFPGTEHNDCHWTGWHSEEDSELRFGPNLFAVGVKCDGKFCDNKSYYVCSP